MSDIVDILTPFNTQKEYQYHLIWQSSLKNPNQNQTLDLQELYVMIRFQLLSYLFFPDYLYNYFWFLVQPDLAFFLQFGQQRQGNLIFTLIKFKYWRQISMPRLSSPKLKCYIKLYENHENQLIIPIQDHLSKKILRINHNQEYNILELLQQEWKEGIDVTTDCILSSSMIQKIVLTLKIFMLNPQDARIQEFVTQVQPLNLYTNIVVCFPHLEQHLYNLLKHIFSLQDLQAQAIDCAYNFNKIVKIFRKQVKSFLRKARTNDQLNIQIINQTKFYETEQEINNISATIERLHQLTKSLKRQNIYDEYKVLFQQIINRLKGKKFQFIRQEILIFLVLFIQIRKIKYSKHIFFQEIRKNQKKYLLYQLMNDFSEDNLVNIQFRQKNMHQLSYEIKLAYQRQKQNDPMIKDFIELLHTIENSQMNRRLLDEMVSKCANIFPSLWIYQFGLIVQRMFTPHLICCTEDNLFDPYTFEFDYDKIKIVLNIRKLRDILFQDNFSKQVIDRLQGFLKNHFYNLKEIIQKIKFIDVEDESFDKIEPLFKVYFKIKRLNSNIRCYLLYQFEITIEQKLQAAVYFVQMTKKLRLTKRQRLQKLIEKFKRSVSSGL